MLQSNESMWGNSSIFLIEKKNFNFNLNKIYKVITLNVPFNDMKKLQQITKIKIKINIFTHV